MKTIYKILIATCAIVFALNLNAQTVTNVEALNHLSEEFAAEWETNLQKVEQYAKEYNVPIRQDLPDGRTIQMIDVQDGIPVYYTTSNYGAAQTTRADRLWVGGSSGLDLDGAGYSQLGEWDAGVIRTSHQEFTDQGETRVTNMDGGPTHEHSTHVAGTMVAAGVNNSAHGMLYAGNLMAWEWTSDNAEMAAAAADGLEISNHSYNMVTGWWWNGGWQWAGNPAIDPDEDYKFGFYSNGSRALDVIANNAPNYLIVWAGGNNRGEGPGGSGPENDGGSDGYDCIPSEPIAKNILTVGAVNQVTNYTGPNDVVMSSFSGWGPADDGRIKPDIVGKGVSVFSTSDGSDNSYTSMSGTSMASPNVAGSMALLQYYHQDLFNEVMLSSTLKGLVLHTADEAGQNPGPDYRFGWGLMNTARAAEIITKDTLQNLIDVLVLADGEEYTREITIPQDSILRVTICWNDPKGMPVGASLNPRDPMIVNDLDLWITNVGNTKFYPYKLDPDIPGAAATTNSKNNVDNVEMVFIPETPAGTYTIHVGHDGELEDGEQVFSLIVTGITDMPEPECVDDLVTPENGAEDLLLNQYISWDPATYATSYDVYFGTDGGGVDTPTNVYDGENFEETSFDYLLDPDTTYYIQIVPRNEQGPASGCDQIWSFSTMPSVTAYPFNEQFSDIDPPEIPFGYQTVDNSDGVWMSNDLIGHFDGTSMICLNPEGLVETDFDNWLMSLPFTVKAGEDYDVSLWYKNAVPGTDESMSVYWGAGPFADDMNNLVFKDNSFDDNDWLEGTGLITPEDDAVIFIGFYIKTNNGYGVYLDDITVDGWSVGISPKPESEDARIYAYGKHIMIDADQQWHDADIRIVNMMGQVVYTGKYNRSMVVDLSSVSQPGIYIVNLSNNKNATSQKVMIE